MNTFKLPSTFACAGLLLASATAFAADASKTPKVGDKAPMVSGKDQDGKT